MKKYNVYGSVVGAVYIGTVEANDKSEAEQKGWELDQHVSLCHQCARNISDLEIEEIEVEEV